MMNDKEEYDPNDLSIKNAYATRWIWYHTLLALLIAFSNLLLALLLVTQIIIIDKL